MPGYSNVDLSPLIGGLVGGLFKNSEMESIMPTTYGQRFWSSALGQDPYAAQREYQMRVKLMEPQYQYQLKLQQNQQAFDEKRIGIEQKNKLDAQAHEQLLRTMEAQGIGYTPEAANEFTRTQLPNIRPQVQATMGAQTSGANLKARQNQQTYDLLGTDPGRSAYQNFNLGTWNAPSADNEYRLASAAATRAETPYRGPYMQSQTDLNKAQARRTGYINVGPGEAVLDALGIPSGGSIYNQRPSDVSIGPNGQMIPGSPGGIQVLNAAGEPGVIVRKGGGAGGANVGFGSIPGWGGTPMRLPGQTVSAPAAPVPAPQAESGFRRPYVGLIPNYAANANPYMFAPNMPDPAATRGLIKDIGTGIGNIWTKLFSTAPATPAPQPMAPQMPVPLPEPNTAPALVPMRPALPVLPINPSTNYLGGPIDYNLLYPRLVR